MILRFLTAPWLKRVLWALIFLQGVLAVWISTPWITADSVEYLKLADALAQGRYGAWTAEGFEPDALRPPGYPIVLYLLGHLLSFPTWVISALQVGVLFVSIFLVQLMLERFSIEPSPMLALAAVYPFPAVYSAYVMTEAWATLTVTSVAALLVLGSRSRVTYLVVGVITGAGVLLRADLLLLPPLAASVIFALETQSGSPVSKSVAKAAACLLAALLCVLPYMMWNYVNFGHAKPIPLAGALGNSLYSATWQPILSHNDMNALHDGVVTPRAEASGLGNEVRAMNQVIGAPALTAPWNPAAYPTREMQISSTKHTLRFALQRISHNPQNYVQHIASNSWRLWNTGNYPASAPTSAIVTLSVFSGLIMLAGLGGVIMSLVGPAGWPLPRWIIVLFLYVPSVHLFLHTEARYTAPARPLLLLFAGGFCWWAIKQLSLKKSGHKRLS